MASDTVGILPNTRFVPLAWRNLLSNKRRLLRSSAGIGFAVLLMLVQLGFERAFFDASLGVVRQLDGDLFVMRASKYRFGGEDPFAPADLDPARNSRRGTNPIWSRPLPSIPTTRCFSCPRSWRKPVS